MKEEMQLWRCLKQIPGIGQKSAFRICQGVGLMPKTPYKFVTEKQTQALEAYVDTKPMFEEYWQLGVVGADYTRKMKEKRDQLINLGSYRGQRIKYGLPANGQRTRNNGVTARKMARAKLL